MKSSIVPFSAIGWTMAFSPPLLSQALSVSSQITTQRVSVDSSEVEANDQSAWCRTQALAVSHDGHLVAFTSRASNLVADDGNDQEDVFVRDRVLGTTERISVSSTGGDAKGASNTLSISGDGRYVAFCSGASNLVTGDTNGSWDVFVRDRLLDTTERVNVASSGAESLPGTLFGISISAGGRFVAFSTDASNLVANDLNPSFDVFVHDRVLHTTELVSTGSNGQPGSASSISPSISADGRFVAFSTNAPLESNDAWPGTDVYVRDRQAQATSIVSVDPNGLPADFHSFFGVLSADGRRVAFISAATNLVANDTDELPDVFLRDLQTGTTKLAARNPGTPLDYLSQAMSISDDGRFVAFESLSYDLVPNDFNGFGDVFVYDDWTGSVGRVSVNALGIEASSASGCPAISGNGRVVAFESEATNLVPFDTNRSVDIFVRDRSHTKLPLVHR
jgi:Tol biopolymer transport system component